MTYFDDDDAAANTPGGSTRARSAAGPELLGARWALLLALALLAAFALAIAAHWWRDHSTNPVEIIVQQPVPADNAPADSRTEVTAPDPGDNP